MAVLLGLSALLAILLGIGTLAWWRVGDNWADAEHKKFQPKAKSGPGPQVIKSTNEPATPEPEREAH